MQEVAQQEFYSYLCCNFETSSHIAKTKLA